MKCQIQSGVALVQKTEASEVVNQVAVVATRQAIAGIRASRSQGDRL